MAWKDEIQHVVVLMLENQSFDRLLGFLRLDDASQPGRPGRGAHVRHRAHSGDDVCRRARADRALIE